MALSIAKKSRAVVAKMAVCLDELSNESFDKALSVFSNIPNATNSSTMLDYLKHHLVDSALSEPEIVANLIGMNAVRLNRNISASNFVADVALALVEDKALMSEKAKLRIIKLIELDSLTLAAKVKNLQGEYKSVFTTARILSDLRPIFNDDCSVPIGTIISHTLKLSYHENGEEKDFFVSMDTEDLEKLKSALERANIKVTALKNFGERSGVKSYV